MKTNRLWWMSFGLCVVLGLGPPMPARGQTIRGYGWIDAGGAVLNDTDLRSYFNQNVEGSEVTFDPGFRLGLGIGCEFTPWVAAEIETGFTWNSIKDITGPSYVDASIYQAPILVNLKLQLPLELRNRSRLVPMIGGGVGGAGVTLDADEITLGTVTSYGTAYDFVFAYQGMAGLRYDLNQNLSIGIYYRYFVADPPSWEPDLYLWTYGRTQFGSLQSHQLSLGLTWRF